MFAGLAGWATKTQPVLSVGGNRGVEVVGWKKKRMDAEEGELQQNSELAMLSAMTVDFESLAKRHLHAVRIECS
jgi:hypothetical protein